MNLEWHLRIAGALLLALAALNMYLPRRFGWREELQRVSLMTRQVFFVHAFFIFLILVLFGLLSLLGARALLERGPLAAAILGGFTLFWGLRLAVQLVVYDASLWRGNRLLTAAHIGFTAFWGYLTAVYGIALAAQWRG